MFGWVYLIHLDRPLGDLGNPRGQARHYIGWALNVADRLATHRAGRGAAFTRAAVDLGIAFDVVRTWPGDRAVERKIKQAKRGPRLCPCCCPVSAMIQLALPLDDNDLWPDPPARAMDWYEAQQCQRWRAMRAALVPAGLDDIPF